jgi:predicted amidophosphoribosyltransferase
VRPREFEGKRVLLIDDVFTTGATMNECAGALKKAGAMEVLGFTLTQPIT